MSSQPRVLAFVMAGGEGSRLHPLTANRCKPAMPFNGKHRIVDFVLSNLVNSGIYATYLLVQYKSQSLIEHVRQAWTMARFIPQHFITVVPPQMSEGRKWFQGTADAVFQNLELIDSFRPDVVAVFGADHIYRMDVRQMVDFHVRNNAHATVATLPVPLAQCDQFGIVETDERHRICDFKEKPRSARPMPGSTTHALASMGNYLFDADVLRDALHRMCASGSTDFGKHILPSMVDSHRLLAYDFDANTIPGTEPYEEHAYWRDVGTIDAYFAAHFDTLGAAPRFRLTNRHWPVYANAEQGESAQVEGGSIQRSSIGAGCVVDGATLDHAMLRSSVLVERSARLEHAIVMERSRIGRGACVRRAIIDQDNDVPPHERIGMDPGADRLRFHVTDSGIVVVPAGFFPPRQQVTMVSVAGRPQLAADSLPLRVAA